MHIIATMTTANGSKRSGLAAARWSMERKAAHIVFGSRRWLERQIEAVARGGSGRKVLEIGSGRQDLGEGAYSMARLFPYDDVLQSDIDSSFGHRVIDVTTMTFDAEFDLVLCLSVLEHLPEPAGAVERVRVALRPGGLAVFSTPFAFPYHDEPSDFWRFTEHGLRRLTDSFADVELRHRGPRRLPFTVMCLARTAGAP